jgi:putative flippase GtrA
LDAADIHQGGLSKQVVIRQINDDQRRKVRSMSWLGRSALRSPAGRLTWFALAGLGGFAVDAAVLSIMTAQGLDPRFARLLSFGCALVATWLINRSLTFGDRTGAATIDEFLRYASASAMAGLINLAVFAILVAQGSPLAHMPVLAAACATGVSMGVNFWSYLTVVFVPRAIAPRAN